MRLIINAPNVHTGGGLTLLNAILEVLDEKYQGQLFLDERFDLPEKFTQYFFVHRIAPTFLKRLFGEWRLKKVVQAGDIVLCLGNLPPLFKLKGDILVFLQNRYLIEKRTLKGFSLRVKARITLERLWFIWRKKRVKRFIVQSPTMKRLMEGQARKSAIIMPFIKDAQGYKRTIQSFSVINHHTYDFLYVASGEPHKNHRNLVLAWMHLAFQNIWPSLCLTLDESRFPDLWRWVREQKNRYNLKIENVGETPADSIRGLYANARALIYPSLVESFGLPLIEARKIGLAILSSELDYVRDVVDPEESFDPNSPISIARAVKRYLGIRNEELPILDCSTFLARLIEETKRDEK